MVVTLNNVIELLSDTLSVDAESLAEDTLLMGNLPEFDSMAIVSILMQIEDLYGVEVAEDELTGDAFESVATLLEFIEIQQAASSI